MPHGGTLPSTTPFVRRAVVTDKPEHARMRAALWRDEDPAELESDLDDFLADPTQVAFVAERSEGRLCGFAEASIRRYANSNDEAPCAFLEGWWVDEVDRRAGVGRALVAAVENWARGLGFTELGSDSLLDNALGHAAHRALGFEERESVVYFRKQLSDHGDSAESVASADLAADLWRTNTDLAQVCLGHPFVRGLASGSLAINSFKGYIAQDAYFLEAFARAYAFALARSPDRHGVDSFQRLLAGVADELKLHTTYAERWQIDLEHVQPVSSTRNYTEFLLAVAGLGGTGEICAATTPCMRLYAYLGHGLAAEGSANPANPYHEWVESYASEEFEALAAMLERLLTRYAEKSTRIRHIYRRAMELELAFFDASFRGMLT